MAVSRRSVLAVLAAGAASSTVSGCAGGPDPVAAWRDPGAGETDIRRWGLAHAILAPNPHNRQPWLIQLDGADGFVFSADLERLLPQTDPFDRQIVVGCGAFLELFDLAMKARGRRAEITLWPEGAPEARLDARPIAHVRVTEDAGARDPLFDAIGARRTNREPFEERAVAGDALQAIGAAAAGEAVRVGHVEGGALRDQLRALAWAAFETEFSTPAAHLETVDLIRVGRAEIARHRDGIAIDGLMPEIGKLLGLVNRETLADITNAQTRQGLEAWRPLALDAPAFVWLTTADNSRAMQIAAGRGYARMNLAATQAGLAMHPWSQALQEYPQQAAHYAEAERLLGADGEIVQMLARVGYGPPVPPAPRRGLGEHVRA